MANIEKRHSNVHIPRVQQKQIVINRRSHVGVPGGLGSMSPMASHHSPIGLGLGVAGDIAHKGVGDMKNKREGEKKDMQDLNDRLANYITLVRSLETENKALREQLKKKRKDFDPEPMKDIYQTEIDETKKLLEHAQKENAELKVTISSLQDEVEDQRAVSVHQETRIEQLEDKVNSLNDENSHRTAECEMLRRKVQELEKQVVHWKAKYKEVYNQLQATRNDLKDETNQRIAECSRAEALQEELDFLKTITDAEIKEYKAMLSKEDETGTNVREAWNNELSKCMKELRDEYEQRLNDISEEMSNRYESQIQQIRQNAPKVDQATMMHSKDETRKIRSESSQKDLRIKDLESQLDRMKIEIRSLTAQLDSANDELQQEKDLRAVEVRKLHDEMETMIRELQMLMDAKMTLELEIAAYRKLLEGEESRLSIGHISEVVGGYRSEVGDALSNILDQSGKGDAKNGDSASTSTSTGRITMQRTSKSVLSIAEVDSNGRYVTLENTSSRRQKTTVNLKGWKLNRVFAGTSFMPEVNLDFLFSDEVVIDAEQSIKLWAKKFEKDADIKKGDIVSTVDDWGQVNRNSLLTLYDEKEAVKATLTIKVVF